MRLYKGLILLLLFSTQFLFAQKSRFVNFGIEDGMLNSQVKTIEQDDEGSLWIGTVAGLLKYDGEFSSFGEENGLAENWITASYKDESGNIWFGHWGGGMTLYRIKDHKFIDCKVEASTGYNLITSITDNGSGEIWIGTSSNGVFRYNKSLEKIDRYESDHLPNKINTLECDVNGNIWVGTDVGLIVCYKVAEENYNPILINVATGFSSNLITSIKNVSNKELWIGTADKGLYRFKQLQSQYRKLIKYEFNRLFTKLELPSEHVKTIASDLNTVWVGMEKSGVLQLNLEDDFEKKEKIIKSSIQLTNKQEERYFNANIIFNDREDNVWVGTDIALSRYLGDLFNVYTIQDSIKSNLVWETYASKNGEIWLGTSNGVSRLSIKNDKIDQVLNLGEENGLSENLVVAISEDIEGRIWLGTENTGINILDKNNKVIKRISSINGLPDNQIFTLQEEGDYMWVGTKKGVVRINKYDFTIKLFTKKDGLGGNKVYDIFKAKDGSLWFAILGGILTKYNGTSFEVFDESKGVRQKFITSITQDGLDNIWFGSYGSGILKYDGQKFTSISKKNGLTSNNIQFLVADEQNNLWIGLTLGLDKYDQKVEKINHYGKKQGFAGIEPNEKSASVDNKGNIWFGTTRGAIKFSPIKDKINIVEPITSLKGLKVSLEDRVFPEDGEFSYDENNLTFKVQALSLTNPNEVRYKYCLEGFDKEWTRATDIREITYSNLETGAYTFKVKASNNNGVWNNKARSYTFYINPPFWKRKWFIILISLIGIISLYIALKMREKSFADRQKVLESQVSQRTRELRVEKELSEYQKDIIGSKNKHITDSINYAKKIQDAVLPPINKINEFIPDNFIFYEPRDIVSGDFYWLNESNGKIYAAAVDCTGHGVPGAFMSIIGYNALDKIINELKIEEPAAILDQLNIEITNVLRQDEQAIVSDGMDIALLSLDFDNSVAEFAGAYNPLYIVRNEELYEYEGDRLPIGYSSKKKDSENGYTNHSFQIEKGDMLYIFSDGFVDQKGGKRNKKYKYPRYRGLLVELSKKNSEQQLEALQSELFEWMGDNPQYDDMLIWGIRI